VVDLALLLEYVAAIPGVQRLRYTTSHPNEFSQRLVDTYARIPVLANQVHLPVQHGSDRMLAAMKRGYTTLQFKSTVRALRRVRPDISITSDFIVGFPGETEDDFAKLLQLVDDVKFDQSYCFTYSVRPGTPAANLTDDVPAAVKLARLHRLQAAIEVHAQAMSRAMVGTTQRVLVQGKSRKNHLPNSHASGAVQMQARTECNRVVHFDGQPRQIGQLLSMHITAALPHSLRGEVVMQEPAAALG
jgi:tRNA-2-methylthio-N6-dimethylallyladenosine synthase